MNSRERLKSRSGFILISAGCAIGCGNIWKFPWMTGQYGGAGFILIYLICLLVMGIPVMTVEFSLGRAAQASPFTMLTRLQGPGQKWNLYGYFALAGNVALMCFYTVVTGWFIFYFVSFLTGSSEALAYTSLITNPVTSVCYLAVTVIIGFTLLSFGLQNGLEYITKCMMTALFVLMIALAIHSGSLEGAVESYRFCFLPEFSGIDGHVIVAAMNQAFFTLSLGIGSMSIFGSYIGKEKSLLGESMSVAFLDTSVAILAALIIFPACYTYGVDVTSGPTLVFDSMATIFNNMDGGRFWGMLFFLFMTFAALSSVLAVFENILAMVREITGWSREKGCLVCGIGIFLLSLTTALGYSVLKFSPFAKGSTWYDLWDFIVTTNILPLGSIALMVFATSRRLGWGWDNLVREANEGDGIKIRSWMKIVFTYLVPVLIAVVYVYGLVTYPWK